MSSIEALQRKYNLSSELLSSWHQAVDALSVKDFYTSELQSDYHIDQKGLWRVDIPDEITGDLDNF